MNEGWILFQTSTAWELTALGGADFPKCEFENSISASELAEQVTGHIAEHGLAHRGCMLAIGSTAVVAGSFPVSDAADLRRRTLAYQFEDTVPLAAEESVADFVIHEKRVFGVAVETASLLPVVTALEQHGVPIQSIFPEALLGVQSWLETDWPHACDWIIWEERGVWDLVRLEGRAVDKWLHIQSDSGDVMRQFAVELLESGRTLRVVLVNVSPPVEASLARLGDIEMARCQGESLRHYARSGAAFIRSGVCVPWIELRRDALSAGDPYRALRRDLWWVGVSVAVLLAALTVAFAGRASRHHAELVRLDAQKAAEFRAAFPDGRVPAAVLSRLRSEHTRLSGARGATAAADLPVPALNVLFEFLSGLPPGVRCSFREVRIEDGELDLDAELRTFGDTNILVSSLRARGFDIAPPSSVQQEGGTISTRVFGSISPAVDSGDKGP